MIPEEIIKFIIETGLGVLIQQALPQLPGLAKKARGYVKYIPRIPYHAPRIELINRELERDIILSALTDSPHLRIIYFVGEGGIGKTRLLQDAHRLVNDKTFFVQLRWGSLLDLYHTELHSVSAFQDAIVRGLDPEGKYFQRFFKAKDHFNILLAEGLTGNALEVERHKLNRIFFENYGVFARDYRPVIMIDTVESLTHESDWVESLCKLEKDSVAVREWLLDEVGKLENTVILMAGRSSPDFQATLEKANKNYPGRLQTWLLQPLSRGDSKKFLNHLLKDASPSSNYLIENSDVLWQVTRGLPVQLALVVDLVSQGEYTSKSGIDMGVNIEEWGKQLVGQLFAYNYPDRRVYFLLGLARKGMTAELLHYLEPERSDYDVEMEKLKATSLVKTRAGSKELFLHDALYELFDAYPPTQAILKPWYEQLANYYRGKYYESQLIRDQRSQMAINWFYYELRLNPRHAFEAVYLKLREMALKGHELELDLQLRDELLKFMRDVGDNRRQGIPTITKDEIDRDGAVRWLKRYIIQSRYGDANSIAETILRLAPNTVSSFISDNKKHNTTYSEKQLRTAKEVLNSTDWLFWGHLLTYYGESLVYSGVPESKGHLIINKGIKMLLKKKMDRNRSLIWLRTKVLGRAHNTLGYSLRSHDHYGHALLAYQNASRYFEKTDFNDERADTLNNIAFILSNLGMLEKAEAIVHEALELRQQLGQRYPLALSYNTLGLIYSLQGKHDLGRKESQNALDICEELKIPRGIGLACNALGYILRKQGEGWKVGQCSLPQAEQYFDQASTRLKRAIDIFSKEVIEPIRKWEAYNELGSLFREWSYLLDCQNDNEKSKIYYEHAIKYLLAAVQVAQDHKMRFKEADTCDDLAKVFQNRGDTQKAKYWIKRTQSLVPRKYKFMSGEKCKNLSESGEAFWLILGKSHWQHAVWKLHALKRISPVRKKYQEYTQSVIESFTLAAYYFELYWRNTLVNQSRFYSMQDQILELKIPIPEVRKMISSVEDKYGIDASTFLKVFSVKSMKSTVKGDAHV